MKNLLIFLVSSFFICSTVMGQKVQRYDLESFSELSFDGRAEILLSKSDSPSIALEAKNASDIDDYKIEIRNGSLNIEFKEKRKRKKNNLPKIYILINYTDLEKITLDGLSTVRSKQTVASNYLSINADGISTIEMDVDIAKRLEIESDGISRISVSGSTDYGIFSIDGIGKIDLTDLVVKKGVDKSSSGLARIRM